jgi:ActR/RegA family two-component response regulator
MSGTKHCAAKRILVVEDDYLLAQDVAAAVAESGGEVIGPVPSANRAINSINLEGVDGAVVDVRLQDGPAYVVADLLVNLGVPFVFLTGNSKMIPARFSSVAVFEKPGELGEVAKAIADLTQAHQDAISYRVTRIGTVWNWTVCQGVSVAAEGTAETSISARVQALESASRLKSH